MPMQYYKDAQKLAQKERRSCISQGRYPYLPVLDDFIPAEKSAHGTDLGVIQIPADFIVGTKSAGRTTAFARNFMPLLGENTEFATKWMQLCQAHLEEGISNPVLVYEYMNRYYVEEGNKRVSILKYFDAVNIEAHVIRVLPERCDDREVEIYYELVAFEKWSGVNFVEFSRPGRYGELQRALGKEPEQVWTEEERKAFTNAYYLFSRAYKACGGDRLRSTTGDAMLAYIEIYGYQDLRSKTEREIKRTITKLWEEFILQQEELPIDLKLAPEEEKKTGLLAKVLPTGQPKIQKVAFINDKNPDTSGWTHGHEAGRLHVQQVFRDRIMTTAYHDALDGDPMDVIQQAIEDGNTLIFTTSPRMLPVSLRAAIEHPEVTILNCSLNKSHRYIRTYYARMYEAKFIIGALAGAMTKTDQLGYICNYPIFGQIAGINAFALGAKTVNPRAKVYLEWSTVGGLNAATKRLTDRGIDLISSQDLAKCDEDDYTFGLARLTEAGPVNLAMPVWQWGVYYERMLRRILSGAFRAEYEGSTKALNYYWGMAAGVVEVRCSELLPESTRKLAEFLRRGICSGVCDPFYGPLYTQDGRTIGSDDRPLAPEQIVSMDWLVENVVGDLPKYEELSEEGRTTVDMVGVGPCRKDGTQPF